VDTFKRVGTDDDVGDRRAIVKDEHSVTAAGILVGVAWMAAIELLVLEVFAASDGAGGWERDDWTGASGDVKGLRSRHTGNDREECDLGHHNERVGGGWLISWRTWWVFWKMAGSQRLNLGLMI
jgi:hypothetical protein